MALTEQSNHYHHIAGGAVYSFHHHGNNVRVPLLPDRPQGEAIQLCLFHQASAVLLIPAALLPVDDRDRDIFAMLKIITQKKETNH